MADCLRVLLINHDHAAVQRLEQALEGKFELKIVSDPEDLLACSDDWASAPSLFASSLPELEALLDQSRALQQMRDFQLAASQAAGALISAKSDSALDHAINRCLENTGSLLRADRCHVFLYSRDHRLITNSHEWHAEGITAEKQRVSDTPSEHFGWLHQTLLDEGIVQIDTLSDLPPQADTLKAELEAQQVRSLLMVSMRGALGSLIGTLGLDSVSQPRHWTRDDIAMLRIMAGVIGTSLEQHRSRVAQQELLEYRRLISRLSLTFLKTPIEALDQVIDEGLASIGTFFNVDRAYVFDYDYAEQTSSNTHEWCAPGVSSEIDKLQGLPFDLSPEWLAQHQQGEAFLVRDVAALEPCKLREMLLKQQISSLITVPLMDDRSCLGYVGLDVVCGQPDKLGDNELDLLQLFADLLVSVLKRKHTDEALRQAASVFEHANEGIMITNAEGVITDVNNAFCLLTGYDASSLLGSNPRILNSRFHTAEHHVRMWQALEKVGSWDGEVWNRRPNGELYAVQITISAIRDQTGQIERYVALFSDITQQKKHEAELEQLAHYDSLTGLPNRSLLADRLRQAMQQAKRRELQIAVAYLDLDGFKEVNDNYGHHSGDRLLETVADRMQHTLRQGDTLARLGGDEFIAVLVDLPNREAALPLLQRLLDSVARPVQQNGKQLRVSASIGVSFYPQASTVNTTQLVQQADQAMYRAKLSGKNRYHVHSDDDGISQSSTST